jgi:hypothetical protein
LSSLNIKILARWKTPAALSFLYKNCLFYVIPPTTVGKKRRIQGGARTLGKDSVLSTPVKPIKIIFVLFLTVYK